MSDASAVMRTVSSVRVTDCRTSRASGTVMSKCDHLALLSVALETSSKDYQSYSEIYIYGVWP